MRQQDSEEFCNLLILRSALSGFREDFPFSGSSRMAVSGHPIYGDKIFETAANANRSSNFGQEN